MLFFQFSTFFTQHLCQLKGNGNKRDFAFKIKKLCSTQLGRASQTPSKVESERFLVKHRITLCLEKRTATTVTNVECELPAH